MPASKKELALDVEYVKEILDLRIPECEFYWLVQQGTRGKVGNKAGTLSTQGHIQIQVNKNIFKAHRLVWFVTYGVFPDGVIDHINGERSDNRIENLRDVPNRVNRQNQKKCKRADMALPTGVNVHISNGKAYGYMSHWCDMDGKQQRYYFSILKYGSHEAAIAAAKARREFEVSELNLQGANYTERHGIVLGAKK